MLPFADKTITLYNRIEFDDVITNKTNTAWHRTVLNGCTWSKSLQALQVGNIEISSDDYVVKIPQSTKFVEKWDYKKLSLEEQKTFFTGDIGDIVILGVAEEEIAINGSVTGLKSKYEGRILTVKGFSNNTGENIPLGHYQIIGA